MCHCHVGLLEGNSLSFRLLLAINQEWKTEAVACYRQGWHRSQPPLTVSSLPTRWKGNEPQAMFGRWGGPLEWILLREGNVQMAMQHQPKQHPQSVKHVRKKRTNKNNKVDTRYEILENLPLSQVWIILTWIKVPWENWEAGKSCLRRKAYPPLLSVDTFNPSYYVSCD